MRRHLGRRSLRASGRRRGLASAIVAWFRLDLDQQRRVTRGDFVAISDHLVDDFPAIEQRAVAASEIANPRTTGSALDGKVRARDERVGQIEVGVL